MLKAVALIVGIAALGQSAAAQVRITEYMYQGVDGEFVEFTNLGAAPVDMTGWSFDDDSGVPGSMSLSSLGMLAPGESAIMTEAAEATFRAAWSLAPSVRIVGGNTNNLSRNDVINLYDSSSALVDRLTFGDQNFPGTIRANAISGWTGFANLGTNNIAAWVLSSVGDAQGSVRSAGNDLANPGRYIPAPGGLAALSAAGLLAIRRRRGR